jgi:hypothetical protein
MGYSCLMQSKVTWTTGECVGGVWTGSKAKSTQINVPEYAMFIIVHTNFILLLFKVKQAMM